MDVKLAIVAFIFIQYLGYTYAYLGDYRDMDGISRYEGQRGDVRKIHVDPSCYPKSIWYLQRNGAAFPSTEEINDIESLATIRDGIVANFEADRGNLSRAAYRALRDWNFDTAIEATPNELSPAGYNEIVRIAQRYIEEFPKLLTKDYSNKTYYFQSEASDRSIESANAFIDTLFGVDAHLTVTTQVIPEGRDTLLNPYDGSCPGLVLPDPFDAATNFTTTQPFIDALQYVSDFLGFETPLTSDVLIAMFLACGYESAWYQEIMPQGVWCAALTQPGRKVAEYYFDLLYYRLAGYSSEASERAGCGLVKELYERLGTAVGDLKYQNRRQKFAAFFVHEPMIMLFHTALGLLRDKPPLTAFNFLEQKDRKFRTSRVEPFAANVAVVLYQCQTESKKKKPSVSYNKVLFLRNEKPLPGLPGCHEGLCSWEAFLNLVKPVASKCNYLKFC